jgi:hypothetical protein
VKRFRGGLVFKAHRLFVPLNSRLSSDNEEEAAQTKGTGRTTTRSQEFAPEAVALKLLRV